MLRVGGLAIVTFPNAGHRRCRSRLAEQGRAPATRASARWHWYNTPDIRLVTVADFDELCELKGWQVRHRLLLDTAARRDVADDRDADLAIYALGL
jgi:methionine biosynthesis protein MetW